MKTYILIEGDREFVEEGINREYERGYVLLNIAARTSQRDGDGTVLVAAMVAATEIRSDEGISVEVNVTP